MNDVPNVRERTLMDEVGTAASLMQQEVTTEEIAMPIYQTAHYQVRPEAVDLVKRAIGEFVRYVTENEPGSRLYSAWQQADDPTRFVHLFIFEDEAAHEAHGRSAAVRAFEDVYTPELTAGPVIFTDYQLVAANTP